MSGLDLSRAGVVDTEELQQAAEDAFELVERTRKELEEKLGMEAPPQPFEGPPTLNDVDISTLTNDDLAKYYVQYVAYSIYVNVKVAETECMEKAAAGVLKQVMGRTENALRAGGIKGVELKAQLDVHPVVVDAVVEYNKTYFLKKLSKAYYEAYSKQASALSRVIELRKLEFEQQKREDSLGKPSGSKKKAPARFRRRK